MTERLRLRGWRLEDAPAAFEMYGDPEVVRHIGGQVQPSVEAARELLETIVERASILPPGMGSFPVELRATGEVIGTALLKPLPGVDGLQTEDVEIGWHLVRRQWGHGYATEFGAALLDHGFGTLALPVLHAVVAPANTASHAVACRIGMRAVGTTARYYGGTTLEHYRLERAEWSSAREP